MNGVCSVFSLFSCLWINLRITFWSDYHLLLPILLTCDFGLSSWLEAFFLVFFMFNNEPLMSVGMWRESVSMIVKTFTEGTIMLNESFSFVAGSGQCYRISEDEKWKFSHHLLTSMLMGSWVKFWSAQNISGASQQKKKKTGKKLNINWFLSARLAKAIFHSF